MSENSTTLLVNPALDNIYNDNYLNKKRNYDFTEVMDRFVKRRILKVSNEHTKVPRFEEVEFKAHGLYNFFLMPKKRVFYKRVESWVGVIEELLESSFIAKLETKENSTFERATFDFDVVSPEDKSFLQVGAIFYWSVGFENFKGQVSRRSMLRFKRARELRDEEVNEVLDDIKVIDDNINWK